MSYLLASGSYKAGQITAYVVIALLIVAVAWRFARRRR
jgi:hypothetical protein